MKIVEAHGYARDIGRSIGEALRQEIRDHIAGFLTRSPAELDKPIAIFRRALETHTPGVLQQFEGMAEGANLPLERILALNLPEGNPTPMADLAECSNVVFADGPDGPLWGKNNDGLHPPAAHPVTNARGQRPRAILKLYPTIGLPTMCITFCGWLSGGDMINVAGLMVGHSSVGSRFQQNPLHAPALQWMYRIMFYSRNVRDYLWHLSRLPLYGKGFTQVLVDNEGTIRSLEIACPLVQVRHPKDERGHMHCVNHYQLPQLAHIHRRTPEGLAQSKKRQATLERLGAHGQHSIEHMKEILRHHGPGAICRHGGDAGSWTEYSMIGIPDEGKLLVADGPPCETAYREIRL